MVSITNLLFVTWVICPMSYLSKILFENHTEHLTQCRYGEPGGTAVSACHQYSWVSWVQLSSAAHCSSCVMWSTNNSDWHVCLFVFCQTLEQILHTVDSFLVNSVNTIELNTTEHWHFSHLGKWAVLNIFLPVVSDSLLLVSDHRVLLQTTY